MPNLENIKSDIKALDVAEAWQLLNWLDEHLNVLWDQQMEADAKAGKLDKLLEQARTDIAERKVRPL